MDKWTIWKIKLFKDLEKRFEKLDKTLSIIIQGPIHERMKTSIPIYKKIVKTGRHTRSGNVVISYWKGDDISKITDLCDSEEVTLVENKYEDLKFSQSPKVTRGPNPWVYQNHSTLEGLKKATGSLAIKVRSDEIYPSLDLFYDKLLKNREQGDTERIITSDIYFRVDSFEKFHPSDHVIAGRTNLLKRAFEISTALSKSDKYKNHRFPEQLICHAILEAKGVEAKPYKSKKIMSENFEIIPIKKLSGSVWTTSLKNYKELKHAETGWCSDISDI